MGDEYLKLKDLPMEEAVRAIHQMKRPGFDIHEIEDRSITTMEFV